MAILISDLQNGITQKLGNRQDLATKYIKWVKESVQELTESMPVEELRVVGPTVNLTANQPNYALSFFLGGGSDILTQIVSFFIYFDTTVTNTSTGFNLTYETPAAIETKLTIPGMPQKYTRLGPNVYVGPKPDKTYAIFMKYQRENPFTQPDGAAGDTVFMPNDWKDIIEIAAAQRGAAELRMLDYADRYYRMLFGDPEFQSTGTAGKGQPGLIHRRVYQQQRDSENNSRRMRLITGKYCKGV